MRLKSVCALAALTLAAVIGTPAVHADTVYLEQGWHYVEAAGGTLPSTVYDETTASFTMTEGTISGAGYENYRYTISISPTGEFVGEPATGVTAPFTGEFFIFDGVHVDPVSSGTVAGTASKTFNSFEVWDQNPDTGEWFFTGEMDWFFRNFNYSGTFNPTSGAVLDFPAGSVAFQGELGFDGFAFFSGQLNAAAVPLPASATMGLGLIGALGAAQVARRRFRTA